MNLPRVSSHPQGLPQDRGILQVVQSRGDVAHQRHKEERHLKHMACHEVQSFHHFVIPGDRIQIEDEGQEP